MEEDKDTQGNLKNNYTDLRSGFILGHLQKISEKAKTSMDGYMNGYEHY